MRTPLSYPSLMVVAVWLVLAPRLASSQEPSVADVLARAANYVSDFNRELSGIVAEERYIQTWVRGKRSLDSGPTRRQLVSDVMLVRPAPSDDWVQYRDVFEVDGAPIRDRQERLTRLFLEPSPSAAAQAARIQEESSRHNIGDIPRTLNTPLFALQFLSLAHQPRFRFTRSRNRAAAVNSEGAADSTAFRVSAEIWVIQYEEVQSPTFVGTADGRDVRARGRFWIEPATGRILMSELIVGDRERSGKVDVSYQSEPLLGLLVPIEMRELYEQRRHRSRIEAVATYGRFRQFQVQVDERIAPPPSADGR